MKIQIKQIDWSGWNGGSSSEKDFIYDIKLNKHVIVKSRKYTRRFWLPKVENIFSFKVVEIGDKHIVIETKGIAGEEFDSNKKKYIPKQTILHLEETKEFRTPTMDEGSNFYITLKIA